MADRFEAIADCPRCGRLDIHLMRAPDPTVVRPEALECVGFRDYGGARMKTFEPRPAMREADYEIIRTCKCGHEWGQT